MITIIIRQNDTINNDDDNDYATLNGMEMWQVSDCCSLEDWSFISALEYI